MDLAIFSGKPRFEAPQHVGGPIVEAETRERFHRLADEAFDRNYLTNDGPLARRLEEEVARADFERWIAPELAQFEAAVDRALADAGLREGEVDRVFLTGGTSLVPAVRRLFERRFGRALREDPERESGTWPDLVLIDGGIGQLNAARLTELVPGWRDADIWFCGPAPFGQSLKKDLGALGLPESRFHQELFQMR